MAPLCVSSDNNSDKSLSSLLFDLPDACCPSNDWIRAMTSSARLQRQANLSEFVGADVVAVEGESVDVEVGTDVGVDVGTGVGDIVETFNDVVVITGVDVVVGREVGVVV